MARKKKEIRVASADFETDPFEWGIIPAPFCCGFYTPEEGYFYFWGDDCAQQFVRFIESIETPMMIYFHNGGKFDFYFLLEHASGDIRIIASRIVEFKIGIHTFRDSFAAVPVALGKLDKGDIDYNKMHHSRRDENREEILVYLERDVMSLYKLMAKFVETFGPKLTGPSAAMSELRKLHPFVAQGEEHDKRFRQFYFGGRVQCFEGGKIEGKFKVFDINSAYPFVMRNYRHPTGSGYISIKNPVLLSNGTIDRFGDHFYFAIVEGYNRGAFCSRDDDGSLTFAKEYGEFYVTSHEMKVALKHDLFTPTEIKWAFVAQQEISFVQFVDTWMRVKIESEEAGDILMRTFAKIIMASAYGKFSQNPEAFADHVIKRAGEDCPGGRPTMFIGDSVIYEFDCEEKAYFDVATAASITGAARAYLLDAIASAVRPLYCDTDSLICEDLPLELHATKLGAWKTEAEGDRVYIAGKKLYAVFDGPKCIKKASKGVRLSGTEIACIAEGGEVTYANPVPTFSLKNFGRFTKRKVRNRLRSKNLSV